MGGQAKWPKEVREARGLVGVGKTPSGASRPHRIMQRNVQRLINESLGGRKTLSRERLIELGFPQPEDVPVATGIDPGEASEEEVPVTDESGTEPERTL